MRQISGRNADQIMEDSIRRRLRTVLASRGAQGWRAYTSRFASGSRKAGAVNCIVDFPENAPDSALPHPGDTIGLTFRMGRKKCMFSTVLQSVERVAEGTLVTLTWPTRLEQLQRRAYERVAPPGSGVVTVRFWLERLKAAAEETRDVRHGQLEDLSAGGMRIQTSDQAKVEIGATYKCVFAPRPGAPPLFLEATLRHHQATNEGRASLGFQFVGYETTDEGCRLLDRIAQVVSSYQRTEIRTARRTRTAGAVRQ